MLVLKTKKENEESPATEGARRATGVAGEAAGRNGDRPDLEVSDKATRRRFSAAYKRRIVREADQCSQPGELGALLRREGLYGSNLSAWRRQRKEPVGRLEWLARLVGFWGPVGQGFAEARTESPAEGRPRPAHR